MVDEVSDGLIAYNAYYYASNKDATYDILPYSYFTIITVLAITSNYILAYSALLKMRLDQGDYEPS